MNESTPERRPVPPEIERSIARWCWQSALLQRLYMLLGLGAILAPLIVSTFADGMETKYVRLLSFMGAASAACIGGFRLSQRGNEMRKAYFDLVALKLEFQAKDSKITEEQLARRYRALAAVFVPVFGPDGGTAARANRPDGPD